MKLTKPIAALAALALSGGALFGTAMVANASMDTYTPPVEECIPSEGTEAYDEKIVDVEAYDEIIIDSEAHWQRYSAKGSWKEDYAPPFPSDDWQANVQGDPHNIGVAGAYFVSNENSGNTDWFYLEWVPEVSHVVHHDEVSHIVHHDAVPPVTCDPESVPCAVSGDWYTEADDVAPIETAEGFVFNGGSGDAVGYRHVVSGNLQGLTEITYSATGDLDVFYVRIVINSLADGGYAYDSLTVISEGPVNGSSVASSNKRGFITKTLDEWAAFLPNNTITSIGFHLDSGATAEQSVTLSEFDGNCLNGEFGWPETPVPALFAADPTPPTCGVAGSFAFSNDFPNADVTITPAYSGPGEYLIEATTTNGAKFPDGTTYKSKSIEVLGALLYQNANSEVDCYIEPKQNAVSDGEAPCEATSFVRTTTVFTLDPVTGQYDTGVSSDEDVTVEPTACPSDEEVLAFTGTQNVGVLGLAGLTLLLIGALFAAVHFARRKLALKGADSEDVE